MRNGENGTGKAYRTIVQAALVMLLMAALVMAAPFAFAAEDLSGYDAGDVALINQIIEINGLDAKKDAPKQWNFAGWNGATPKRLTALYLRERELSGSLDLTAGTALIRVDVSDAYLTQVDASGLTALNILDCGVNYLTSLDVTGCVNLTELMCDNNALESLDISMCTRLVNLGCNENRLTDLDSLNCPDTLESIFCSENPLGELDLENYGRLVFLNCANNDLKELKIKGCENLRGLDCSNNEISILALSEYGKIKELKIEDNPLSLLVLPGNEADRLTVKPNVLGEAQLIAFDFGSKAVSLAATPLDGSIFERWELTPGRESAENPITFTLKGDVTVKPIFADPSGVVAVTGIRISGSARLTAGEEYAFAAKVTPTGYTTKNPVTWKSSDPAVLTVTDQGVATAVSPGTATITASIEDHDGHVYSGALKVTVREAAAFDIGIEVLAVAKGKAMALPVLLGYKGTWTTDDPGIARVNAGQKRVTAVKAGETKLTYTVESVAGNKAIVLKDRKLKAGDTYTITLYVRKSGQLPKSVSIDQKKLTLDTLENTEAQLSATVKPAKAPDRAVFWTSNKPGIATVDAQGKVTAIAPGTCKITAISANLKRRSVTVTVLGAVTKVTLEEKKLTLEVGENYLLTAKVNDDALDKTLSWTSAKPGIATVDEDGVVTAIKKGKVKITAKAANGKKAVITVTVK